MDASAAAIGPGLAVTVQCQRPRRTLSPPSLPTARARAHGRHRLVVSSTATAQCAGSARPAGVESGIGLNRQCRRIVAMRSGMSVAV